MQFCKSGSLYGQTAPSTGQMTRNSLAPPAVFCAELSKLKSAIKKVEKPNIIPNTGGIRYGCAVVQAVQLSLSLGLSGVSAAGFRCARMAFAMIRPIQPSTHPPMMTASVHSLSPAYRHKDPVMPVLPKSQVKKNLRRQSVCVQFRASPISAESCVLSPHPPKPALREPPQGVACLLLD